MSISPISVVLASGSVYRRQLLGRLLADFESLSPQIDEIRLADESPAEMAARLAEAKAQACLADRPGAVIIGSDQVPACGTEILQKPGSHERAIQQLQRCSGQEVIFYTAVTLIWPDYDQCASHLDKTIVRFRDLSTAEIENYLQFDKPYDCAGSFKVESRGVTLFDSFESQDPTGLQGLPLIWVANQLRKHSVI
ncbi:MAG: nucleoside triphosphate pyrophosphatase [Gammaproteobacteria bacterium]|jgi:septum formation protein|nr:septum formation protein Maf [Chromatiales bacterium]MDP6674308.1 nucleoside triphosphate pyrophosphatase [Gammaproteobacteria bacterium]